MNDMYCMNMDYILGEIKHVFKNLTRYANIETKNLGFGALGSLRVAKKKKTTTGLLSPSYKKTINKRRVKAD